MEPWRMVAFRGQGEKWAGASDQQTGMELGHSEREAERHSGCSVMHCCVRVVLGVARAEGHVSVCSQRE